MKNRENCRKCFNFYYFFRQLRFLFSSSRLKMCVFESVRFSIRIIGEFCFFLGNLVALLNKEEKRGNLLEEMRVG